MRREGRERIELLGGLAVAKPTTTKAGDLGGLVETQKL